MYDFSSSSFATTIVDLFFSSTSIDLTVPAISEIIASPFGFLASNNSWTLGRPWVISEPATPPVWNVRIVNWVPGSPIDWAAIIPTVSPTLAILPLAMFLP